MENKNNLNPIISYLTLVENVYGLFSPPSVKSTYTVISKNTVTVSFIRVCFVQEH